MFSTGTEVFESEDYPLPSIRKVFDVPSEDIDTTSVNKKDMLTRTYAVTPDEDAVSLYQRSVDIQDKLQELKLIYKSSLTNAKKYPTLLKDIEQLETQLKSIIENVNYKNVLLPKVDMPITKSYQKLNYTKLKTSMNQLNSISILSNAKHVHYSLYIPSTTDNLTLASLSEKISELEKSLTKSIPSMLVNSSFLDRFHEIEERIAPINETHLRNTTLTVKMVITELTNFQRLLNRKPEDSFKTNQQLLSDIQRINELYQELDDITNVQVVTQDLLKKTALLKQYYQQSASMEQSLQEIKANNKNIKESCATQTQFLNKLSAKIKAHSRFILSNMEDIDKLMATHY